MMYDRKFEDCVEVIDSPVVAPRSWEGEFTASDDFDLIAYFDEDGKRNVVWFTYPVDQTEFLD